MITAPLPERMGSLLAAVELLAYEGHRQQHALTSEGAPASHQSQRHLRKICGQTPRHASSTTPSRICLACSKSDGVTGSNPG
jgi:hypothetical protein